MLFHLLYTADNTKSGGAKATVLNSEYTSGEFG